MLKTKAEFATLRLNEDLKPYMSRYLSDLVSHMVEKYQPSSRTKRLIELCCRDFEFSSEHVDGPSWSVLGIDLKRPSAASFEFEDRVYNEATDEWDYVPACVCKNRVKVPTSTFTAIEENIFLYDYEQDAASHTYESALIYCRPPSYDRYPNSRHLSMRQMRESWISSERARSSCNAAQASPICFRSLSGTTSFLRHPLPAHGPTLRPSFRFLTVCSIWREP